jgi:uncharacterized membrane protein
LLAWNWHDLCSCPQRYDARQEATTAAPRRISLETTRNLWINIHESLWFAPAVCAVVAITLSIAVPEVDKRFAATLEPYRRAIFSGSPEAAQTVLSVIAASTITVVSLLFSITIVALQQASTQFSPRIMRNFTRDRGNQIVLGVYLATFLYSLLVLRQIGGDGGNGDTGVYGLAVSLAIGFAVACLALLIYFIHHGTTLFQASSIIENVHGALRQHIGRLCVSDDTHAAQPDDPDAREFQRQMGGDPTTMVTSDCAGFLRSIGGQALANVVNDGAWLIVRQPIGTYVTEGEVLVEVGGMELDEALQRRIRAQFVLDRERTIRQDPMFGVRQLVDIAVKALSPSINDPTTAEHALSALADALGAIAGHEFPGPVRTFLREGDAGGSVTFWVPRPGFADIVDASISQIRRAGSDHVHVLVTILDVLVTVGERCSESQLASLQRQIDDIVWYAEHGNFATRDREELRDKITVARCLLNDRAEACRAGNDASQRAVDSLNVPGT